jgi:uncharacterized membrane protein YkgB
MDGVNLNKAATNNRKQLIFMKTTKQRLLNIVITMSVAINLALLAGLGYIAADDNYVNHLCSIMNSPVMVYVPKDTDISGAATSIKSPAKQ